jgi:hypothetical protein
MSIQGSGSFTSGAIYSASFVLDGKMGVTEFASQKGFKVEGLSHLVENPELARPSISNLNMPKTTQPANLNTKQFVHPPLTLKPGL